MCRRVCSITAMCSCIMLVLHVCRLSILVTCVMRCVAACTARARVMACMLCDGMHAACGMHAHECNY